jgi:acetyltransferase
MSTEVAPPAVNPVEPAAPQSSKPEKKTPNLQAIFYPRSVAVIGTNNVEGSVPFDIFYNILRHRFNGPVYPVSPGQSHVAGVKAYKYVVDIPGDVDLAVLVFPSTVFHMALEQCGKKGVKAAIIISAGFREAGEAGIKREQQLKEIAAKYNMSFIGPNCLGVINTDPESQLNASFARLMPDQGDIAFLSQSGALCTAVLDYAAALGIGFSKFVSFGNKADVSEMDLMDYLKDDPKTRAILLYLEEVSAGRELMEAARRVIEHSGKPVLAIKAGRTAAGAAAAASHTGSLAGSDEVCDAAFKQAGILRCSNIEEMFNKAVGMTRQPLPKGNRIAIVTNAGGPGVLAADRAIQCGVKLAAFSEETMAALKKDLPPTANVKNPVDVIGDARADRYRAALAAVLADEGVDGACVILTPQSMTQIEEIATDLCATAARFEKPVYASFMGGVEVAGGIEILRKNNIPHYTLPETAVEVFASAWEFAEILAKPRKQDYNTQTERSSKIARALLAKAAEHGRHHLPEADANHVLAAYGLPVLNNLTALTEQDAMYLAENIGFPVAMKIVSDDIVHKADVGGVRLNIATAEEAKDAFRQMTESVAKAYPSAHVRGVLIEQMAPQGQEVILGVKRDPSFGPVIMFGLGGNLVELFKDVSFRIAPVDREMAAEMIEEVRSSKLLHGYRGRPPRDIAATCDCIARLSLLATECSSIRELDINPLIVRAEGEGCNVADARIMI